MIKKAFFILKDFSSIIYLRKGGSFQESDFIPRKERKNILNMPQRIIIQYFIRVLIKPFCILCVEKNCPRDRLTLSL